jgi:hypothetical protein
MRQHELERGSSGRILWEDPLGGSSGILAVHKVSGGWNRMNESYLRWAMELANQEYNGRIEEVCGVEEMKVKIYNEKGDEVGFDEVIDWWLERYEGLEHLTEGGNTNPESWYAINTILKRCFLKIKNRRGDPMVKDLMIDSQREQEEEWIREQIEEIKRSKMEMMNDEENM